MEITVEVHREDGNYWSQVEQYPGCFSIGRTLSDLHVCLEECLALYLDDPALKITAGELKIGRVPVTIATVSTGEI